MSGYIHSGVAGKMDKIRNAHPDSILVTDKLGNAIETDITIGLLKTAMSDLSSRVTDLETGMSNLLNRVEALESANTSEVS